MPKSKIVATLILCFLVFNGCKPETDICTYNIYYLPFGFAFKNFDVEEIDTLYLKTIITNDRQSLVIKTDTIICDSFRIVDDIISGGQSNTPNTYYGFGDMQEGYEYELIIPALQEQIKVFDIQSGPKSHSFKVEGRCSPGSQQASFRLYTAKFESNFKVNLIKGKSKTPLDNIALVDKH